MSSLIGVASFVVTARSLGPTEFGMLVLVFTFGNAVVRLCGFQSWQALIKFASEHLAAGRSGSAAAVFRFGFLLDIGAALVAAGITLLGASTAAELLGWRDAVTNGVLLYAVAVAFSLNGAATAALRLFDRFGAIAFAQVAASLFKLGVVALVAWRSPDFQSFLIAWIVAHIFSHVLLNVLALATLRQRGLFSRSEEHVGMSAVVSAPVWRYVITTNLDGMVRVVRELDSQVVALFVDEAAAGLLRVGRQIATFVGRLVDAFFEAIYPQLMELANERSWTLFGTFVSRTALQVGLFATLPLIGFAVLGQPFLQYVFGNEFADAYLPTVIFLAAMAVWGFAQPYSPALMALGAIRRMLLNHCVASLVYLSLLFYLTPLFAAVGAAVAMVGLYLVWGGLTVVTFYATRPKAGF